MQIEADEEVSLFVRAPRQVAWSSTRRLSRLSPLAPPNWRSGATRWIARFLARQNPSLLDPIGTVGSYFTDGEPRAHKAPRRRAYAGEQCYIRR